MFVSRRGRIMLREPVIGRLLDAASQPSRSEAKLFASGRNSSATIERAVVMPTIRPNILLIMVDDCGYADLGCTGQNDYATPALDRLASEGVRFTHAYANAPLCTNTRVALITGRYQYRLPIGLVEPLRWSDRDAPEMGIPPGHPTLPVLLRGAGYRTTLIGKWHLGYLSR